MTSIHNVIVLAILCSNFYNIFLTPNPFISCINITCTSRLTFIHNLNIKLPSKLYSVEPNKTLNSKKFNVLSNLEEWKKDMKEMVGNWYVFYPFDLNKLPKLIPNPNIRDSSLFLDHAGRVMGPEHFETPTGNYLLDSKDYHHLVDENNKVHSRRCVMVMKGKEYHSTIRMILAGRVFFSDPVPSDEVKFFAMSPAVFMGQAFLESHVSEAMDDIYSRLERQMMRYDGEGNDIDPRLWTFDNLDGKGSEFTWMHGKDNWKLVGPFVGYKCLEEYVNDQVPEEYSREELYHNIVDPLELTCKRHTPRDELDDVVKRIVRAVFTDRKGMEGICIENEEYLKLLEDEMITLGDKGPDYYNGSFE